MPSITERPNREIVDLIADIASPYCDHVVRVPDATGTKASLLMSFGPLDRPGVVLSAHTDVVPVAGQAWTSDPFALTRRGDALLGRGTSDMKGFIAVVLAALPALKAAASAVPVHLAFSYDEEVGCRGAPDLVAAVAALPARPALCIVGEPTGLDVMRAHKGKRAFRVTATGRGGHSALPHRAANALEGLVRLAAGLSDLAGELREGPSDGAFDPPYSTLHLGSLHGGGALNVVPDRAVLEFELRHVPSMDTGPVLARIADLADAARTALQAQAGEADLVVETLSDYPALATPPGAPALAAVARLSEGAAGGTLAFGTEAGLYHAAGIPTVVCGPGDIARAHKADEWISLAELAAADAMMARLAALLGRPADAWIRS